jgi:hypothetical protein
MTRKPFWEAFWVGLASSTQLYGYRRGEKYRNVGQVDAAWKSVGRHLYDGVRSVTGDVEDRRREELKK